MIKKIFSIMSISVALLLVSCTSHIEPPPLLLNSVISAPFANGFDFGYGKITVSELVERLKTVTADNGANLQVKGWNKDDNVYTAQVTNGKRVVMTLVFRHMLNQNGLYSKMEAVVDDEVIPGVEVLRWLTSVTGPFTETSSSKANTTALGSILFP